MTGNDATIEVNGSAAHTIAANILSSLGIDAEDISEADIDVGFETETTISLHADGPLAGVLAAQMVQGIEWDEHTATSVSASFMEGDDAGPAPAGDDAGDPAPPAAYRPHVTPLVDSVDPEYVEFPSNEPGRLRENTHLHVVAHLLKEWYEVVDDEEWATTEDIADFAGDDMTHSQVTSALSRLFVSKGLAVRQQVPGAQSRKYAYHPTKQLVEEVERLGDYTIGDGDTDE